MKRLFAFLFSLSLLTGCAHSISVNPELARIDVPSTATLIPKQAAFFLADELRSTTLTTPGGGGDRVNYKPYQDLEVGLIKVLRNTFTNAIRLTAPPDLAELKRRNIHYLVTPVITTTSSSGSFVLWAPTDFKLTLQCKLFDLTTGAVVVKETVGEGQYDQAENGNSFPASHGSEAGRRAALAALLKMQQTLLESPELR